MHPSINPSQRTTRFNSNFNFSFHLTRRHALVLLTLLLAFTAVFTLTGPQTAQAAAKPNTAALGFNPCAPGITIGPSQCDCPSGYVFQSVSGPDPVFGCVLSSVVGFTDVAGTVIQPVVSKSNCQLFADAALSIPAKNKDGSDVLVTPHSTWPEKATIAPSVDLVSVVGQALYTDASCFGDARTIVISTDGKTLTIKKGGVDWKTLSAPTGEIITGASFGSSGLAVTFKNPKGTRPDTTTLLATANAAAAAAAKLFSFAANAPKANANTDAANLAAAINAINAGNPDAADGNTANTNNAPNIHPTNFADAANSANIWAAQGVVIATQASTADVINNYYSANTAITGDIAYAAAAQFGYVAKIAADALGYATQAGNTDAANAAKAAQSAADAAQKAANQFVADWESSMDKPTVVTYTIEQVEAWPKA